MTSRSRSNAVLTLLASYPPAAGRRRRNSGDGGPQSSGLVDSGDYSKSWDTAAAYFKGAITKEKC